MAIYFHDEKISSELKNKRSVKAWLNAILKTEKKLAGQINIIFTTDKHLLEINRKYLDKDYYTDIITFDYSEGKYISGDLFISLERVSENAKEYKTETQNELMRVMAHGLLHLIGYGDSTEDEKNHMRRLEDRCLEYSPGSY